MEYKMNTESVSLGGGNSLPPNENGGGGVVVPGTTNVGVRINVEQNPGVPSPAAVGGGTVGGAIFASGGASASTEYGAGKRKRGRPRKYDAEGRITPGYLRSPVAAAAQTPPPPCFTLTTTPSGNAKRGPTDSGTLKTPAASLSEMLLQPGGGGLTAHVLTVYPGEDVAGKILFFVQQQGGRGVCVASANGTVSHTTIRQPDSCGGLMTYEGRFEILSLVGSYTVCEEGGVRVRNGGLSVTFSSSNGRVIGGGVAGLLLAATPVQLILASFEAPKHNRPTSSQFSPANANANATPSANVTPQAKQIVVHTHPNSAPEWNQYEQAGPSQNTSFGVVKNL